MATSLLVNGVCCATRVVKVVDDDVVFVLDRLVVVLDRLVVVLDRLVVVLDLEDVDTLLEDEVRRVIKAVIVTLLVEVVLRRVVVVRAGAVLLEFCESDDLDEV